MVVSRAFSCPHYRRELTLGRALRWSFAVLLIVLAFPCILVAAFTMTATEYLTEE